MVVGVLSPAQEAWERARAQVLGIQSGQEPEVSKKGERWWGKGKAGGRVG